MLIGGEYEVRIKGEKTGASMVRGVSVRALMYEGGQKGGKSQGEIKIEEGRSGRDQTDIMGS